MRRPTGRFSDETGVALVSVLGFSLVAFLLISAAITYALNAMPQVRGHDDWNAALAAAEAGVDDVRYRLNQDPFYWASFDNGNPALTGWRHVPGLDSRAEYHYQIDGSEVARFGHVDVVSTGRVGDETRTISVRLRRQGFLDAIYFTDFDTSDPYALTTSESFRETLDERCSRYHPERPRQAINSGGCSDIRFAPADELRGPTRSNDAIMIRTNDDEPRFLGPVFTGWDGRNSSENCQSGGESGGICNRLYIRDAGSSGEPFFRDGISTIERLPLPETTTSLSDQAFETGCRYEGPTYIRFIADPSPQMHVISPLTDPSTVNSGCGTGSSVTGGSDGGINGTVPLKDGEVLYAAESDASISGHPLEMPPSATVSEPNQTTRITTSYEPAYDGRAGDMFVHGTLDGQVTVAAQNDITVVHDLLYEDRTPDSDDLTGLISGNNVLVYHPIAVVRTQTRSCWGGGWGCGGWSSGSTQTTDAELHGRNVAPFSLDSAMPSSMLPGTPVLWEDAQIDAAILALNRSFGVQEFSRGDGLGTLSIHGAIAQRFRGPVATGSATSIATGYAKDYVYDERLRYLSPPYFLSPERSPWDRRMWGELQTPRDCEASETPHEDACLPPG